MNRYGTTVYRNVSVTRTGGDGYGRKKRGRAGSERAFSAIHNQFFSLAKSQYHQQNVVKANTLAFNTLLTLNELNGHDLTMSELAEELDITKQQLTKLVNDLEEKELVKRIHDSKNRRQVYIRITERGAQMLADLKNRMMDGTINALSAYTEEELAELDECLVKLGTLLEKFNTNV